MPTDCGSNRAYEFGDFVLDAQHAAVLRGGLEIPLRPKAFNVLCYFVEHPDQLVTRTELFTAIWGRTVVTDDAITQCLIVIRKAIDDSSHEAIRTVPRRGYIFTLPVHAHDAPVATSVVAAPHDNRGQLFIVLATGLLLLTAVAYEMQRYRETNTTEIITGPPVAPNSVAVLPFVNLGPGGDREYFSEGVAEEIRNLLAQRPDLQVVARDSRLRGPSRAV